MSRSVQRYNKVSKQVQNNDNKPGRKKNLCESWRQHTIESAQQHIWNCNKFYEEVVNLKSQVHKLENEQVETKLEMFDNKSDILDAEFEINPFKSKLKLKGDINYKECDKIYKKWGTRTIVY